MVMCLRGGSGRVPHISACFVHGTVHIAKLWAQCISHENLVSVPGFSNMYKKVKQLNVRSLIRFSFFGTWGSY